MREDPIDTGNDKIELVLVEDSKPLNQLYVSILTGAGFVVHSFENIADTRAYLAHSEPAAILLDRQLPDGDGFDLLDELAEQQRNIVTIIMTAHGSVDSAVDALQRGAADFLEKPFRRERLLVTLNNALQKRALAVTVKKIRREIQRENFEGIIGSSLSMQVVYRIIENAAPSRASVFITGASGTGKELCARAVHQRSNRAQGPFVPVNCAAIPKELFESEMFGHKKGAFSGAISDRIGAAEAADGGTLFLDELCEMDLDLQAKLLRFLQSGMIQRIGTNELKPVDVRIVCATNRNPAADVANGLFREDLFYRLNVVPLEIPALKEREQDTLVIANYLLSKFSADEGKSFKRFDDEVEALFLDYGWPGNVRQLENVVRNVVVLNSGELVTKDMLPSILSESFAGIEPPAGIVDESVVSAPLLQSPVVDIGSSTAAAAASIEPLWVVEKRVIETAIDQCSGNVPRAAACLEVSASTLYRKIKTWDEIVAV